MGLKEVLVKFLGSLANEALATYAGADLVEKTRIRTSNISGLNLDPVIKEGSVNVDQVMKYSNSSITNTKSRLANYIIFHQERCETTAAPGNASQTQDYDNGIIHLRTSQDRGLVKTITFSQMQVPGRVEYKTVGHGDAYDALRIPQNATVTMFGNTIFIPSMEVYIDPDALGFGFGNQKDLDSPSRKLGIGGYYTILKVSTSFNTGVLTTTLNLAFSSYPETRGEPKRTESQISATKQVNDIRKTAQNLKIKQRKAPGGQNSP